MKCACCVPLSHRFFGAPFFALNIFGVAWIFFFQMRKKSFLVNIFNAESKTMERESKTSLNRQICWFIWIFFSYFYLYWLVLLRNSQKSIRHNRDHTDESCAATNIIYVICIHRRHSKTQTLHLKFICDRPMNMKSKCLASLLYKYIHLFMYMVVQWNF